jgi:hypothetical protein
MPSSSTTQSAELIRRLGQFEPLNDDVRVRLVCDDRLHFFIPKRWWANERFDIHPAWIDGERPPGVRKFFVGPHLEVNVGEGVVKWFAGTSLLHPMELAIACECMSFARDVLLAAR